MTRRWYSNADPGTTLSTGINASVTSIPVANAGSFPSSTPFAVIVEKGTANAEICLVTAVVGSTLTVTRGYNSSTAVSHGNGVAITSGVIALDLDDAAAHVAATGGVHGVTGAFVGTTDAQTLSNKTLTNPAISNPTVTGTLAGANETLSGTLAVTGTTTLGTVTAGAVSASSVASAGAVSASGDASAPALHLTHNSPFQNALEIEPTVGAGPVFSVDQAGSVVAHGSIWSTTSEVVGALLRTTGDGTVDAVLAPRAYVNQAAAGTAYAGHIVYLTAPTGGFAAGLFKGDNTNWLPLATGQAAKATSTSAATLTTSVGLAVPWNANPIVGPTGLYTYNAATGFTVLLAGNYSITAGVAYAGNATGRRGALVAVNGVTNPTAQAVLPSGTTSVPHIPVATVLPLNANDVVTVFAFQDSGGNLNLGGAAELTITRLS